MRQDVVSKAAELIGNPDTDPIWKDVLSPHDYQPHIRLAWCGAFALNRLHAAGLGQDVKWIFGKGFLGRLPKTDRPQPGDIAYFDKPYQHHAIVESVDGETLHTIDGNQGHGPDHLLGTDQGTTVRRVQRHLSAGAYYSIAPWLHDTEPAPPPSIAEVQHALNIAMPPGNTLLVVDGELSPETRTALYWFQRLKGLPITGEIDAATLGGLGL